MQLAPAANRTFRLAGARFQDNVDLEYPNDHEVSKSKNGTRIMVGVENPK